LEDARKDAIEFVCGKAKDAIEFVCGKAEEMVNSNGGFSDATDLVLFRDNLDDLMKLCDELDAAESIRALRKLLLQEYGKREVNKVIPRNLE